MLSPPNPKHSGAALGVFGREGQKDTGSGQQGTSLALSPQNRYRREPLPTEARCRRMPVPGLHQRQDRPRDGGPQLRAAAPEPASATPPALRPQWHGSPHTRGLCLPHRVHPRACGLHLRSAQVDTVTLAVPSGSVELLPHWTSLVCSWRGLPPIYLYLLLFMCLGLRWPGQDCDGRLCPTPFPEQAAGSSGGWACLCLEGSLPMAPQPVTLSPEETGGSLLPLLGLPETAAIYKVPSLHLVLEPRSPHHKGRCFQAGQAL
jgi:hypothetical protein